MLKVLIIQVMRGWKNLLKNSFKIIAIEVWSQDVNSPVIEEFKQLIIDVSTSVKNSIPELSDKKIVFVKFPEVQL